MIPQFVSPSPINNTDDLANGCILQLRLLRMILFLGIPDVISVRCPDRLIESGIAVSSPSIKPVRSPGVIVKSLVLDPVSELIVVLNSSFLAKSCWCLAFLGPDSLVPIN